MKYSRQREIIQQAVKASRVHPTAAEVYDILRPHNPNLSLGTVYR
ncbi:MAG: transcriptional repressor, partial [Clostridiales bacterium]|nr:transcriptional repressor [Clostridiales bacterium]